MDEMCVRLDARRMGAEPKKDFHPMLGESLYICVRSVRDRKVVVAKKKWKESPSVLQMGRAEEESALL